MDLPTTRFRPKPWVRPALLVAGVALAWGLAWWFGWLAYLEPESVRATMSSAGGWGIVVFVLGCVVANLLQVPGMVFIVLGIVAFGEVEGAVLAWASATLAATVTFQVSRMVGGKALDELRNPLARKLMTGLERHPTFTVAAMRTFMQNSPLLNMGLALTPISLPRYVAGTAVGLWVPVLAAALFTSWFV